MTAGLTEPQSELLQSVFQEHPAEEDVPTIDYIKKLIVNVDTVATKKDQPTKDALKRGLNIVYSRLEGMRKTSENMCGNSRLRKLPFEPLPSPFKQPEEIIQPGQVSILYLGGYDHLMQCSIASITLETLFEFRANLTGRIAPFLTVVEDAHTFAPSRHEGTQNAVSLPVLRRIITEGRKFGTGLMLISQRPSRLDETIISQCNSFLILRLVNPRDQNFVRQVMENLTEADVRMISGFGPGQGIVSGQVVRFPLPVRVKMDEERRNSEIDDEDFFEQAKSWKPRKRASSRKASGTAAAKNNRRKTSAVSKAKSSKPHGSSKQKDNYGEASTVPVP